MGGQANRLSWNSGGIRHFPLGLVRDLRDNRFMGTGPTMTAATRPGKRKGSNAAGAGLLFAAVSMLALPSAVLAFSSRFDLLQSGSPSVDGGFQPAAVDPRQAR